MTIAWPDLLSTLLADLASREAAGRLDADDRAATAVLMTLDRSLRERGPDGHLGMLADLARECTAFDRQAGVPAALVEGAA